MKHQKDSIKNYHYRLPTFIKKDATIKIMEKTIVNPNKDILIPYRLNLQFMQNNIKLFMISTIKDNAEVIVKVRNGQHKLIV